VVLGTTEIPLDPTFEHGVFVVEETGAGDTPLTVDGTPLPLGTTAYLEPGRSSVTIAGTGRVMVIGGLPFESEILMFWNFVARTPAEMDQAFTDWIDATDRFGEVSSPLERVPAPERRTRA
jgi:redox-sensitive bicupin YhaK (pirin superfamily)